MIRQITAEDFNAFYAIWEEGCKVSFSNPAMDVKSQREYYQRSFLQQIATQDDTFKIWGYFEEDILLGWMSVMPCRPSPILSKHYGEISTYIATASRYKGIAKELAEHLLTYAKENTDLWGVETYVSEENLSAIELTNKFGFTRVGQMPKGQKENGLPNFSIWAYTF